ncbi:MGMT family protein [bacterium]|nr:MGMT family protein [bacterium]
MGISATSPSLGLAPASSSSAGCSGEESALVSNEGVHSRIFDVVSGIPSGSVATYGQVAAIVDRCTPRMVGYAMASVPDGMDIPWHRVINSQGRISLPPGRGGELQRALLEAEGVAFDGRGKIDLGEFGWQGPGGGRV